jgi:hypothetical protein
MLDLFHQFKAFIANKDVAKENTTQLAEVMAIEK